MTRSLFLSVLTIGAALSMTAGVALAGSDTVPAAQILNALKPKSATLFKARNHSLSLWPGTIISDQHRELGIGLLLVSQQHLLQPGRCIVGGDDDTHMLGNSLAMHDG